MRNRLGMAAGAALLVAVLSVTLASASSPRTTGADPATAAAPQPTIAPIQQLSLDVNGAGFTHGDREASTQSVARIGAKVGQVPGFCRLHA